MKKRILAFFMVLVAVLSIAGIKQDTFCAAKAAKKTYWIDVEGDSTKSPVKISIKGKKMSIKGDICKSSTEDFEKVKYLNSIKNLKISSKCKAYITAAGTHEKYSMKSAKAVLKSGEFVGVKMKIIYNIVFNIYYHV